MKFDYPLRPFQVEAGKAWRGHVAAGRQRGLVALPTGCHAPGQFVLMHDGSKKMVQDVRVGDKLAGHDGLGRTVLALRNGESEMVQVLPNNGEPWVVTHDHLLTQQFLFGAGNRGPMFETLAGDLLYSSGSCWGGVRAFGNVQYCFDVERAGRGEYFGFTVDGDHRYLLADGTVTHNCGKTIFAMSLIPESGRTLFLVHRDNLARQTVRAAQRVISDVECGIVMADEDDVEARDLVVASVPTLARQNRLDRLLESQAQYGKFKFVIADEGHHAAAKTWQRVLDSFRVPSCALSATPWRDDDRGLAPIWGLNPIYRMTIDQAIAGECPMVDGTVTQHDGGWLVPYESRQVTCGTLDMSRVRVNPETGDYDLSDLEKEVYRADFAKFVAETVKGVVDEGRLTIAFCASVDQAQRTHEYLEKMGVSAAVADGETDPAERERILCSFQSGKIRALINCQLYVEGADIPEIDCVVNAAPTQSRGKYIQQIGRGLRLCPPHKEYLLIVDIVGAHEAHGLVTAANMGEEVVKEKKDKKNAKPLLLQHQRDREFGMVVSAAKAAQFGLKTKDQKRKHRTRWVTVQEGSVFALPAGEHGALLMVREPGDADMWMGFRLPKDAWTFQEARRIMKRPAERAFAAGVVEDRARKLGVFSLSSEAARWRTQPPTQGQLDQFQKAFPGKVPGTRGDVSEALTTHFLRQSMRGFK